MSDLAKRDKAGGGKGKRLFAPFEERVEKSIVLPLNARSSLLFRSLKHQFNRQKKSGEYARSGNVELYGEICRYIIERQFETSNIINVFVREFALDKPSILDGLALDDLIKNAIERGVSLNTFVKLSDEHIPQRATVQALYDLQSEINDEDIFRIIELSSEEASSCKCDLFNFDGESYVIQIGDQIEVNLNKPEFVNEQNEVIDLYLDIEKELISEPAYG